MSIAIGFLAGLVAAIFVWAVSNPAIEPDPEPGGVVSAEDMLSFIESARTAFTVECFRPCDYQRGYLNCLDDMERYVKMEAKEPCNE